MSGIVQIGYSTPQQSFIEKQGNLVPDNEYASVVGVIRYTSADETEEYIPESSEYSFYFYLCRKTPKVEHTRYRWEFGPVTIDGNEVAIREDGVKRYNTVWPDDYQHCVLRPQARDVLYELYYIELTLPNDAQEHTIEMSATRIQPNMPTQHHKASFTFTTTEHTIVPKTPIRVTDVTPEHMLDKAHITWSTAQYAYIYEVRCQHLDKCGVVIPDTEDMILRTHDNEYTLDLSTLLAGMSYKVTVRAFSATNDAGDWSEPIQIRRPGVAHITIDNAIQVGTPYLKRGGEWYPAATFVKTDDNVWHATQ